MAIFESMFESYNYDGTSVLEEEAEDLGIYPVDEATDDASYMDDVNTAYCEEMYKLNAAMYVIDVQLESAIVHEGASVEVVAENAITDFIKNVKEKIIELWHKFQDWVTKMSMKFKAFMSSASGFIKKHKTDILKKLDKHKSGEDAFTYSGYTYPGITKGDAVDKAFSSGSYKKLVEGSSSDIDVNTSLEEIFEDIGDSLGSSRPTSTANDIVTYYLETVRGEEVTDHTPDKSEVETWIKVNLNASTTLQKIGDAKNKTKREFDKMIKKLKDAESKAKKKDNTTSADKIHKQVSMISSISSFVSRMFSASINVHVEGFRTFAARLKKINGLKDSDDDDNKSKNKSKKSSGGGSKSNSDSSSGETTALALRGSGTVGSVVNASYGSAFDGSLLESVYDMI